MSEQANALAHETLDRFADVVVDMALTVGKLTEEDVVSGVAQPVLDRVDALPWAKLATDIDALIEAPAAAPCPDCGAPSRPSAKWACGSWQDGPARQTSVKCVKRQMAVLKETIAARDEEIV